MGHPVDLVPAPRILLDPDVHLLDVPVLVEKVRAEQYAELLGRLDSVLLGQEVDGVLLAVGGYDVAIVAHQIVLLAAQAQVNVDLVLADLVTHGVLPVDVQQLHVVLAVAVRAKLELIAGD